MWHLCARQNDTTPKWGTNRRAAAPLQLVHSDLAGPITPVSNEGRKYAMVFVDDFSLKTRVMLRGQLSSS